MEVVGGKVFSVQYSVFRKELSPQRRQGREREDDGGIGGAHGAEAEAGFIGGIEVLVSQAQAGYQSDREICRHIGELRGKRNEHGHQMELRNFGPFDAEGSVFNEDRA